MGLRINSVVGYLLIPSLLLLYLGLTRIGKYINWFSLVLLLAVLGVTTAVIISSVLFQKIRKGLNKNELKEFEKQNFRLKTSIILTLILFSGGVLISESSSSIEEISQFQIINKGTSGSERRKQYNLFIKRQGREERYSFGKSTYELYEVGDSIKLTLKSNLFGFDFLEPERWNK